MIPASVNRTFSNDACIVGQLGWKLNDGAKLGWRLGLLDGSELFEGETEGIRLGDAEGRVLGFSLLVGASDGSEDFDG